MRFPLISCFALFIASIASASPSQPFAELETLIKASGSDSRFQSCVDVYFSDPNAVINRPVQNSQLLSYYTLRIGYGIDQTRRLLSQLVKAGNQSRLERMDGTAECRLALVVRGPWNEEFLTLYANPQSDIIVINGTAYRISGPLKSWLTDHLWSSFDALKRANNSIMDE